MLALDIDPTSGRQLSSLLLLLMLMLVLLSGELTVTVQVGGS
jgi:hypothetical protein